MWNKLDLPSIVLQKETNAFSDNLTENLSLRIVKYWDLKRLSTHKSDKEEYIINHKLHLWR